MDKVRIGIIGLGQRGYTLLKNVIIHEDNVEVTALCDTYQDRILDAYKIVQNKRGTSPLQTSNYMDVLTSKQVDAVIIASSWESHIEIAIASLYSGKITALEVGGAYDIDECYKLVEAYEKTKTPFMFLENCCYNRDELLGTALARSGLLGEIVHASGTYTHDVRDEVAFGVEMRHYRQMNYLKRNCENYPTHELGPIAKLLDINRGNRMISLVSVASKAKGMEAYIEMHKDKVSPNLWNQQFKQGDVVNTIITCANGETILLTLNTTLPSFYERNFTVRGTKGLYQQTGNIVLIDEPNVKHELWSGTDAIKSLMDSDQKYQDSFLPSYWKNITEEEINAGHGGMDVYMFRSFIEAVLNKQEMPIDVYDAASWMAISILSEHSISHGGMPVSIPDFTKGKWLKRPRKDVVDFK